MAALPKMKLWYYPRFRSTRPMWLIKELGIEKSVEYCFLDIPASAKGPTPEREEYRKRIHPHATIPALEVEGRPTLLESGAMCLFLADLCGGKLAPDAKDRGEYYNWIMYASCTMDEVMERLCDQWWFLTPETQDPDIIAKYQKKSELCLDVVEKALQGKDYMLGKELTAVDCVVGYNILWAAFPEMNKGALLEGRPNLKAYQARISARPALQETLAFGTK